MTGEGESGESGEMGERGERGEPGDSGDSGDSGELCISGGAWQRAANPRAAVEQGEGVVAAGACFSPPPSFSLPLSLFPLLLWGQTTPQWGLTPSLRELSARGEGVVGGRGRLRRNIR